MCACANGCWEGSPYFFSVLFETKTIVFCFFIFRFVFFFFFLHFISIIFSIFFSFHNTCLTSNSTSFSTSFTGYLPAIFMGSTFYDYISYKILLFSDMLCSTPSSLSRPRWIFCYLFRDLLTFYSLIGRFCYVFFRELSTYSDVSGFFPLIFVFIQHFNHYFVDLLQFCHRCLR